MRLISKNIGEGVVYGVAVVLLVGWIIVRSQPAIAPTRPEPTPVVAERTREDRSLRILTELLIQGELARFRAALTRVREGDFAYREIHQTLAYVARVTDGRVVMERSFEIVHFERLFERYMVATGSLDEEMGFEERLAPLYALIRFLYLEIASATTVSGARSAERYFRALSTVNGNDGSLLSWAERLLSRTREYADRWHHTVDYRHPVWNALTEMALEVAIVRGITFEDKLWRRWDRVGWDGRFVRLYRRVVSGGVGVQTLVDRFGPLEVLLRRTNGGVLTDSSSREVESLWRALKGVVFAHPSPGGERDGG